MIIGYGGEVLLLSKGNLLNVVLEERRPLAYPGIPEGTYEPFSVPFPIYC